MNRSEDFKRGLSQIIAEVLLSLRGHSLIHPKKTVCVNPSNSRLNKSIVQPLSGSLYCQLLTLLTLYLLLLLLLCGCDRRSLVDPDHSVNYAEVTVEFDWRLALMSPMGMSVIFYPVGGGTPLIHKTGDRVSTVRLREGGYNVVGFNYSFDEFDGILFRGTEHYETLEAYAAPLSDVTTQQGMKVTNVTDHPDLLAVDRLEGFEVTAEMVRQTNELVRSRHSQARGAVTLDTRPPARIVLIPVRVVAPGYVKVHLKGLNYVRSAQGVVTGLSRAYFLGRGKPSPVGCSMVFDFHTPVYYEGSKSNGTLEGSFSTFGLLPEDTGTREQGRYGLLFSSVLVDKDQTPFESYFDVTGLIHKEVDVNLNILLRLDVEMGMSGNPQDNTPTIVVPPVRPQDGGAFDVTVGDWGKEENVYL